MIADSLFKARESLVITAFLKPLRHRENRGHREESFRIGFSNKLSDLSNLCASVVKKSQMPFPLSNISLIIVRQLPLSFYLPCSA